MFSRVPHPETLRLRRGTLGRRVGCLSGKTLTSDRLIICNDGIRKYRKELCCAPEAHQGAWDFKGHGQSLGSKGHSGPGSACCAVLWFPGTAVTSCWHAAYLTLINTKGLVMYPAVMCHVMMPCFVAVNAHLSILTLQPELTPSEGDLLRNQRSSTRMHC